MTVSAFDINDNPISLPKPASLYLNQNIFIPSTSLNISFLDVSDIPELHSIKIIHNNKTFFEGLVDNQSFTIDEQGSKLTILARCFISILLDNELFGHSYRVFTPDNCFNEFLKPFGFTEFIYDDFDGIPFLNFYDLKKGTSAFSAVDMFCKLLFRTRPFFYGTTVDARKQKIGAHHTISNSSPNANLHFSSFSKEFNRSGVISSFMSESVIGSKVTLCQSPLDDQIQRTRISYPYSSWKFFGSTLAFADMTDSILQKETYSLTLPYILDCNLYDTVSIDNILYPSSDTLAICDKTVFIDKDGFKTKLTLYKQKFLSFDDGFSTPTLDYQP